MSDPRNDPQPQDLNSKATQVALRLAIVGLLVFWCFAIFRPFLMPFIWGIVLAVALRPAFVWIERVAGGRRKLAAILFVVVCLGVVLVPTILLSESLIQGARSVSSQLEGGELKIPPAPERVAQWPVVGPTVYETWNLASTSLETVLKQFRPQVKALGKGLVALAKQGAVAVLMTSVSLVIAAFLLLRREAVVKTALAIGARIAGPEGEETVRLGGQTIATVAKGVVGVAAIQAALAAVGLLAAGIPGAGLWALILIGAIGGLILHGLIGLFLGAVVLSTGYRFFGRWLAPGEDAQPV